MSSPAEQDAKESPVTQQALQLIAAWEELARLAPRLKVVLPEGMVRLKERIGELHQEGGHKRHLDHGLFNRISTVLARQDRPMTMGELSEALDVPANTATRMVDWLVASGYVERVQDRGDRRVVRVSLTPEGRELHQVMGDFIMRRAVELLERFTEEERDTLVALLRKLARVLNEEAGTTAALFSEYKGRE